MKKSIIQTIILAALVTCSCAKAPDFISREETRVAFDCLAQSTEQNIQSRGDWYIDLNGADWISVSPEKGTGDGVYFQMYTISVGYNKGGSREHTIYVCQGSTRCPVTIHQNRCKFALTGIEISEPLYQYKESASGIRVKYEYAAGDESVSLDADLSGAAAAGLSVEPQQSSDFQPGSGELFIPITGTPSSKGDFEVSVRADGTNIGICKGYVEEYVAPVVILDASGLPARWNFFAAGYTGTGPLTTSQGEHWDLDDPDPHVQATGGNTDARITAVIKDPKSIELSGKTQRYTYNPAIQVLSMVEGDYWLATIPVMYFTEETKISVEAATSGHRNGPGFYILEYSGDGSTWFEAPDATSFEKSDTGEKWKAHFWNNEAATVNAPTGTRKSFDITNPQETYHKYEFPLTGVTIENGNLYLRLRAQKYRYDMSSACSSTWADLKMLEVNFVQQ